MYLTEEVANFYNSRSIMYNMTLRVAMLLLQGKRNRRVAIRILLRAVRVCDRLGDEHHKLFYIVTL